MRGWVVGSVIARISRVPERQAREPSCHCRTDHRNEPIKERAAIGEIVDLGVDADLRDDKRRGLAAYHLAIAHEKHFEAIGAGWHVRGKGQGRMKEAVAEEADAADARRIEPFALLLADERSAELD